MTDPTPNTIAYGENNSTVTSYSGDITTGTSVIFLHPGTLSGIRFYTKTSGSKTYKCSIWAPSGTLLGTVNTNVTGPGSFNATFSSAINITEALIATQSSTAYFLIGVYETTGSNFTGGGTGSRVRPAFTVGGYAYKYEPNYYAAGDARPTSFNAAYRHPIDPLFTVDTTESSVDITFVSPVNGATNQLEKPTIQIDVTSDYEIDLNETIIRHGGNVIWKKDEPKPQWSGHRSEISNGYRYTLIPRNNLTVGTSYILACTAKTVYADITSSSIAYSVASSSPKSSSSESGNRYNQPFWFVHIEGFPYLWFSKVPSNWSEPTGWSYLSGLMLSDLNRVEAFDPLEGIVEPESLTVSILDDSDNTLGKLFAARRNQAEDEAELSTNNMVAGENINIDVKATIPNAPSSDGTIYIGKQTITYSTYSGTRFYSCDRGRYAILDAALNEIKWKPAMSWDPVMEISPLVSIYPKQMKHRTITLYRNYFDSDTGLALDKNQSQIRFRGQIETYADREDHLGFDIASINLMVLLQSNFLNGLAECSLSGFSLTMAEQQIQIKEYVKTNNDYLAESSVPANEVIINITKNNYASLQELLNDINDKFYEAKFVTGKAKARYYISQETDGTLKLSYAPLLYFGDNTEPVVSTTWTDLTELNSKDNPIKAIFVLDSNLVATNLSMVLGFTDDNDYSESPIRTNLDSVELQKQARYSVFNIASWNGSTVIWDPPSMWTKEGAPKASINLANCTAISVNIDENHDFLTTLPDGSPFYIQVGNEIIYRASSVDVTNGLIKLKNTFEDYTHLIGTFKLPDDQIYSVPYTASETDEESLCRQVWAPISCYTISSGSTFNFKRYGVNYLLLQLLCSTGTKNYNGPFDVLPTGWGLSIPRQYIDEDSFNKLYDAYPNAVLKRQYLFNKPEPFIDLLREEATTLDIIVTLKNGKITALPRRPITYANATYHITDTERVGFKPDVQLRAVPEEIVNQIIFRCDYDVLEEDYLREEQFVDGASMIDYGVTNSKEVENRGLKTSLFGYDESAILEIDQAMNNILQDISQENFLYICPISRSLENISAGDIVSVTDAMVPNPTTGTRGITRYIGIVQRVEFNEVTGEGSVEVKLSNASPIYEGASHTIWNSGNLARGIIAHLPASPSPIMTIDPNLFQHNTATSPADVLKTGDHVRIIKPTEPSIYHDTTIAEVNDTTATIADNLPSNMQDSGTVLVVPQNLDTVLNTVEPASQTVFIGSSNGQVTSPLISTIRKGYTLK